MARPEPRPSQLRQLLQRPGARPRLGRAVASLLGASVVAIAVIGILLIWHLVRRGRLIRERLGPPRAVKLPDLEPSESDPEQNPRPREPRT